MGQFTNIAFTPAVKAFQEQFESRKAYARFEGGTVTKDVLGEEEAAFLTERDSFYMATVGSSGWPYIQHRGGPKGFVKVLDEHTIAFANLRGNRQYISMGNIAGEHRVALIFVDYPRRARVKILAYATVHARSESPELWARVGGGASSDSIFVLRVEGIDWNCPKHITPRFTEAEIREMAKPLWAELEELKRENAQLRERLRDG